jgi:hypothetical protein
MWSKLKQRLGLSPKPDRPTMPDEQLRAEAKREHHQAQDEALEREAEEPKPKIWDVNP